MGSLRIRLPKNDLSQVQAKIILLGLDINPVRENDSDITVDVIGDGIKCLEATAFSTVKRVSWRPVAKQTKDDHRRTIHVPRPRP